MHIYDRIFDGYAMLKIPYIHCIYKVLANPTQTQRSILQFAVGFVITPKQPEQKQGIKKCLKREYTALCLKCLPDLSLRSLRKNSRSTAGAEN